MAWIDWDAVIAALDGGHLPASGGEKRIVRIAASLATGHPVSLRDAIPGLDSRSLNLVAAASKVRPSTWDGRWLAGDPRSDRGASAAGDTCRRR
jgi:hypothetical protein